MSGASAKYRESEIIILPADWRKVCVEEFANITTGSRNTQDRVEYGQYPFFVRSQTIESINSYSFDGEAVLTAGDGVGTGKVYHYINGKFDLHQRVYQISDFSPELLGKFFYLIFSTRFFDRIMSMTAKSSVDSVRREMIAAMQIPLPPLPEQQAIARALGDVDGLIASLEALIAKKCCIKQGAMQELLSGHRRLPGFTGEWVVKPIGSLFRPLRSVALSRAQTGSTGDTGYVHYGDIHTKFHGHLDLNDETLPCVDGHMTRNATHLQEGDWVFADASEDYDGVAKAVEIIGTPNRPAVAGLHTLALRDIENSFAPTFKGYLAYAGHFRTQVLRAATGMKVFGVSKSKMLEIELLHPENKNEQAEIAETLHSMDAEIAALEAKLTKTRDVKQGMMQVLLTGEVRLV
jgi:type I restriction enzyme, S subunit